MQERILLCLKRNMTLLPATGKAFHFRAIPCLCAVSQTKLLYENTQRCPQSAAVCFHIRDKLKTETYSMQFAAIKIRPREEKSGPEKGYGEEAQPSSSYSAGEETKCSSMAIAPPAASRSSRGLWS